MAISVYLLDDRRGESVRIYLAQVNTSPAAQTDPVIPTGSVCVLRCMYYNWGMSKLMLYVMLSIMLGGCVVLIVLVNAKSIETCSDLARVHQDMMIERFGADVFSTNRDNQFRSRNQSISDLNARILQACSDSLIAE